MLRWPMARPRCWWPRSSSGSWASACISSSRATGPHHRPSPEPRTPQRSGGRLRHLPVMMGNTITSSRSTRPAARSGRFIEMLPWERSGTGDSAFRRGTASSTSSAMRVEFAQVSGSSSVPGEHDLLDRVERRERRILFRRGEARHQAVGVRPEHQHLIRFGVGPEPLLEQLGAFLAPSKPQAPSRSRPGL